VITLRCTRKLLRRIGAPAAPADTDPTTVLGDWYANLIFWRPQQLVLCMNELSLLLVIVPARDAKALPHRFREAAIAHLLRIGIPHAAVQAEAREMEELQIGATANRRVLGCMNDAAFMLPHLAEGGQYSSIEELEMYFAENIYSTTGYRRPREVALELFNAARTRSGASWTSL
jgi:hypothetical protein